MTSHPLRCTPCPRAGVDERRDVISCFRHLVTRSPFLFRLCAKVNNMLARLHLVGCGVGDVAMRSLGGSMKKTATSKSNSSDDPQRWSLTWIDLRDNDITDEGLRHLSNSLRGAIKNTLATIDFQDNPFTSKGARDFALALDDNSTLQVAQVMWPFAVTEDVQKIVRQLCEANAMPPVQREAYKKRKDFRHLIKKKKKQQELLEDPMLDARDGGDGDDARGGGGASAGTARRGNRRVVDSLPDVGDIGVVLQVAAKGRISSRSKNLSLASTMPGS